MRQLSFILLLMLPLSGCGLVPETTGWDSFYYQYTACPDGHKYPGCEASFQQTAQNHL